MKKTKHVAAVVVTYNRKELLSESIIALKNQNYKDLDIYIIDNASTDGTKEYIKDLINSKNIYYFNTNKNLGGAGGFYYGLKKISEKNYDYAWLMDDDTIVLKDSLVSLVNKAELIKDDFSYLGSIVKWTDESLCLMNVQPLSNNWNNNYDKLKYGLIPLEYSSFVSFFINLKVSKKVGLPIKEFFIYGDDREYSLRLSKLKPGFLDSDSFVIHKMSDNKGIDIVNVDKNRIDRYYYNYRNMMYIYRKYYSTKNLIFFVLTVIYKIFKILFKAHNKRFKRIYVVIKGTFSGIFFNPNVEYVN